MRHKLLEFSSSDGDSTGEIPTLAHGSTGRTAPQLNEASSSDYYEYSDNPPPKEKFKPRPPAPPPQEDEESLEISGETDELDPRAFELEESERGPPGSPSQYFNFCYTLVRTIKSSSKGKRYFYTLMKGEEPLWHAKAKSRHPSGLIPISDKGEAHMNKTCKFRLKCSRGCRQSSLLTAESSSPICTYETLNDGSKMPHFKVTIDSAYFSYDSNILLSKRPKKNRRGLWCLDFHNRLALPSVKNAIFVKDQDVENGEELIMIRKTSEDSLAIDIMSPVPSLVAFTIGVSTFLNKL